MKNRKVFIKKIMCAVTACVVTLSSLSLSASADSSELTGKTAMEITQMMGKGWNLGNTFDATGGNRNDVYSQEQSWGNPKVTKELIDGVKAMGFDTIRIPVTWFRKLNKSNNYEIDAAFLNRVTEVVDYAFANDMFVILNVHHESWVNDPNIDKNYLEISKELEAVWSQLADHFADYDQHLIFEGMNEPRAEGTSHEWTGTKACYDAVNYLNQTFVNTIRNNGKGHNAERALMIPGYAASNSREVLNSIVIPTYDGKQAENVIISVHCYSPYNFCLSDNQSTFNPNSNSDTSDITNMLSTLNTLFLKNDIPVVIGECGATNSGDNLDARIAWFTYFGEKTAEKGIPAVVWDNGARGNSGGECHNYFDRKTGKAAYPELINSFIYGDVDGGVLKNLFIDFENTKEDGQTIINNPDSFGFTSSKLTKAANKNHTEVDGLGFSLAINDKVEDKTAYLSVSKYVGATVKVSAWVRADSNNVVELGINDGSNTTMISGTATEEWTEVGFYATIPSRNTTVYFKCTDNMFVDDITVEVVEAEGSAYFGDGTTVITDTASDTTETSVTVEKTDDKANETNNEGTSADNETTAAVNQPSSNVGARLAMIGGVAVLLIAIVLVVNSAVKKKKN